MKKLPISSEYIWEDQILSRSLKTKESIKRAKGWQPNEIIHLIFFM